MLNFAPYGTNSLGEGKSPKTGRGGEGMPVRTMMRAGTQRHRGTSNREGAATEAIPEAFLRPGVGLCVCFRPRIGQPCSRRWRPPPLVDSTRVADSRWV